MRRDIIPGRFQDGVEAADDGHGQDDVAVFAAHVDVAQHVVGDAPDEVADVESAHGLLPAIGMRRGLTRFGRSDDLSGQYADNNYGTGGADCCQKMGVGWAMNCAEHAAAGLWPEVHTLPRQSFLLA